MSSLTRAVGSVWASVVLLVTLGCSDNNPVVPVSGRIMFDGKPMAGGGSISLMPLTDQPGMAAGGAIAEDGTYKLSTYGDGDGSMTGEFRVVINQVTETEPGNTEDGQKIQKAALSLPVQDRIPEIYSHPKDSPLRMKVEAKDANEINFDLQRNPK